MSSASPFDVEAPPGLFGRPAPSAPAAREPTSEGTAHLRVQLDASLLRSTADMGIGRLRTQKSTAKFSDNKERIPVSQAVMDALSSVAQALNESQDQAANYDCYGQSEAALAHPMPSSFNPPSAEARQPCQGWGHFTLMDRLIVQTDDDEGKPGRNSWLKTASSNNRYGSNRNRFDFPQRPMQSNPGWGAFNPHGLEDGDSQAGAAGDGEDGRERLSSGSGNGSGSSDDGSGQRAAERDLALSSDSMQATPPGSAGSQQGGQGPRSRPGPRRHLASALSLPAGDAAWSSVLAQWDDPDPNPNPNPDQDEDQDQALDLDPKALSGQTLLASPAARAPASAMCTRGSGSGPAAPAGQGSNPRKVQHKLPTPPARALSVTLPIGADHLLELDPDADGGAAGASPGSSPDGSEALFTAKFTAERPLCRHLGCSDPGCPGDLTCPMCPGAGAGCPCDLVFSRYGWTSRRELQAHGLPQPIDIRHRRRMMRSHSRLMGPALQAPPFIRRSLDEPAPAPGPRPPCSPLQRSVSCVLDAAALAPPVRRSFDRPAPVESSGSLFPPLLPEPAADSALCIGTQCDKPGPGGRLLGSFISMRSRLYQPAPLESLFHSASVTPAGDAADAPGAEGGGVARFTGWAVTHAGAGAGAEALHKAGGPGVLQRVQIHTPLQGGEGRGAGGGKAAAAGGGHSADAMSRMVELCASRRFLEGKARELPLAGLGVEGVRHSAHSVQSVQSMHSAQSAPQVDLGMDLEQLRASASMSMARQASSAACPPSPGPAARAAAAKAQQCCPSQQRRGEEAGWKVQLNLGVGPAAAAAQQRLVAGRLRGGCAAHNHPPGAAAAEPAPAPVLPPLHSTAAGRRLAPPLGLRSLMHLPEPGSPTILQQQRISLERSASQLGDYVSISAPQLDIVF